VVAGEPLCGVDEDDGAPSPPEGNIEPREAVVGGRIVCKGGAEESVSVPEACAEAALVGAPVPPALLESWANPMEGGVARKTE
jgi:hypothetical protein